MLSSLESNIPRDQKHRLTLMPGNVMDIEFPKESLGAIFALRFMHFLTGDEFRRLFQSYYDWLSPGGILVVTCANSLYHFINSFQNEYKLNLKLDLEWPGEIHLSGNLKIYLIFSKIICFLYKK
jgi:predicted SAM-dependent methyltransferase